MILLCGLPSARYYFLAHTNEERRSYCATTSRINLSDIRLEKTRVCYSRPIVTDRMRQEAVHIDAWSDAKVVYENIVRISSFAVGAPGIVRSLVFSRSTNACEYGYSPSSAAFCLGVWMIKCNIRF
jgi:hypothetical protein